MFQEALQPVQPSSGPNAFGLRLAESVVALKYVLYLREICDKVRREYEWHNVWRHNTAPGVH